MGLVDKNLQFSDKNIFMPLNSGLQDHSIHQYLFRQIKSNLFNRYELHYYSVLDKEINCALSAIRSIKFDVI